jgi:hypothetical protein
MIPTANQVDTYFRRLEANYGDLNDLLTDAKADLNTIFNATDKPVPAAESLAGLVLEAALGLALPEGKALFSFVNHMVEGAKKMKEKVAEMQRYTKIVDLALQQEVSASASRVSTDYNNGALGMMTTINKIKDQILLQKALNMKLGEVFRSLRGAKPAELFFNSIPWDKPPALVAEKSEDIRYVFTYIFVRLAVFRFVRLNMHRQSNPFDLNLSELLVTNIEPEGISKSGCDFIFKYFSKSFADSKNSAAVLPATNIVAIRNYYDMINNWYPDIAISSGSHEEMVETMGHPDRRHFTTKMAMIASGFKRAIPEVFKIPEFRLN